MSATKMTVQSDSNQRTLAMLQEHLTRLSPSQLADVFQFVRFLEFQAGDSEDADLWQAVIANEQYKALHLHEGLERYDTPEALEAALAAL